MSGRAIRRPGRGAGALLLAILAAGCNGNVKLESDRPPPILEGVELHYRVPGSAGKASDPTFVTLLRRVANSGVDRFQLERTGDETFLLRLPASEGEKLVRVKRILSFQGDLQVKAVAGEQDEAMITAIIEKKAQGAYDPDTESHDVAVVPEPPPAGVTVSRLLVQNAGGMTGADIEDAFPMENEVQGSAVGVKWTPAGAARFGDFTEKHTGGQIAIILDGVVQAAPVIRERIGAKAVISGRYTEERVAEIATILDAGRLPAAPVLEREVIIDNDAAEVPAPAGAPEGPPPEDSDSKE